MTGIAREDAMIEERRHLAHEMRREHATLRRALDEIARQLERLEAEPGPAHRVGRLLGMLAMFRLHLLRHFELEEEGGLLSNRAERNPGVRRTIERLVAEHRELSNRLDGLVESLERTAEGDAGLTDVFAASLRSFLAELGAHERGENELILELVNRDVGVGD